MPLPSFNIPAKDAELIREIARKASALATASSVQYSLMDATMDLTACHANGTPLRLPELLAAADSHPFDFAHDVFGIQRHLDRSTGKLGGCFAPRFMVRQPAARAPQS